MRSCGISILEYSFRELSAITTLALSSFLHLSVNPYLGVREFSDLLSHTNHARFAKGAFALTRMIHMAGTLCRFGLMQLHVHDLGPAAVGYLLAIQRDVKMGRGDSPCNLVII